MKTFNEKSEIQKALGIDELTTEQRDALDNKALGTIDLNIKEYQPIEILGMLASIIYLGWLFFGPGHFFTAGPFAIKITLGMILMTLATLALNTYILGLLRDIPKKTYMAIAYGPLTIPLLFMGIMALLSLNFPIKVNYLKYLEMAGGYLLVAIIFTTIYNKINVTLINLSETDAYKIVSRRKGRK